MGRLGYCVFGPAGSGKTTFCGALERAIRANEREAVVVNLDPACEGETSYSAAVDVRELIDVTTVCERYHFGPNGGMVFAMEYLASNLDWLKGALQDAAPSDDEYFIFDCPGQIELYTHIPAMKSIIRGIRSWNINLGAVFVVDASLVASELSKYLSAILLSTSAMVQLELPWLNVLSKIDLVRGPREKKHDRIARMLLGGGGGGRLREAPPSEERDDGDDDDDDGNDDDANAGVIEEDEEYVDPDTARVANAARIRELCKVDFGWIRQGLLAQRKLEERHETRRHEGDHNDNNNTGTSLPRRSRRRHHRLNAAICDMIEEFSMVRFVGLNNFSQESVEHALALMDDMLQYGEDLEPKEPLDEYEEEEEEEANERPRRLAAGSGEMEEND